MKNIYDNMEMSPSELVLATNELSRTAHKELYHFHDASYRIVMDDLLEAVAAFRGKRVRLHIVSEWTGIVKLATWRSSPGTGDVLFLLRNMGIRPEELLLFRGADIPDLFPWLYYGRRLDVLKKMCLSAKTKSERHINNSDTRVHCHLSALDISRIVASSL